MLKKLGSIFRGTGLGSSVLRSLCYYDSKSYAYVDVQRLEGKANTFLTGQVAEL